MKNSISSGDICNLKSTHRIWINSEHRWSRNDEVLFIVSIMREGPLFNITGIANPGVFMISSFYEPVKLLRKLC